MFSGYKDLAGCVVNMQPGATGNTRAERDMKTPRCALVSARVRVRGVVLQRVSGARRIG